MDELEKTIRDLVERKNAARDDSPEQRFYERQLRALRYRCEEAGGIIEDADPIGWGAYCRPLPDRSCPQGTLVTLAARRSNKAGSRS
jgi:hypothetical protein